MVETDLIGVIKAVYRFAVFRCRAPADALIVPAVAYESVLFALICRIVMVTTIGIVETEYSDTEFAG